MKITRPSLFLLSVLALTACSSDEVEPSAVKQDLSVAPSTHDGAATRAYLQQHLSRAPANLREIARDGGVRQVRIVEGFEHATVVVRAADGTLTQRCVDDAPTALGLLNGATP